LANIDEIEIIELPQIHDPRGNLTFIENSKHIPFDIKRVFYIYDIPTGAKRGAHAHKTLHEFIICLSGSFDVDLDDGIQKKIIHLNRPWLGIHIPPMIWAAEINFDPNSVCLCLTSDFYDADDYIRDYDLFLNLVKGGNH